MMCAAKDSFNLVENLRKTCIKDCKKIDQVTHKYAIYSNNVDCGIYIVYCPGNTQSPKIFYFYQFLVENEEIIANILVDKYKADCMSSSLEDVKQEKLNSIAVTEKELGYASHIFANLGISVIVNPIILKHRESYAAA